MEYSVLGNLRILRPRFPHCQEISWRRTLPGLRALLLTLLAAALSYPLGLALGQPWLLPLLNAAPAYALMATRLRRGDRRGAVLGMLAWAAVLAVCGTLCFRLWPASLDQVVLNGPAYRTEMLHWVRTGEGAEGDPRQFLPQHALHLGAFVGLSLATASTLSILMGAVLMNYMSFYVASLGHAGAPAWVVGLMGWHPWSIVRVAAFCTLGAVLAEPLLARIRPYPYAGLRAARPFLVWAAAGLVADGVIKALLAQQWGLWLRAFIG